MGEEPCNIELGLALGVGHGHAPSLPVRFGGLFPPRMKEEEAREERHIEDERHMVKFKSKIGKEEESEVGNDKEGARKKLRLNKEQLASLEDTFRVHSILNPSQKQGLAKQLNLRPRQVEVWFQNRRARTKLKQTEVDCELLKKCCESLSHENQRLKKELQELRSARPRSPPPFYIRRLKAPELAVCPSCGRMKQSSSMAC